MSAALAWMYATTASVNWLEVLKVLVSLATPAIGFFALRNWQRQDKAKRQAEFLDALVEATNAYITAMATPITIVEMARISMRSHAPSWQEAEEERQLEEGAIPYIQMAGKSHADRMRAALHEARPATIKLRSISIKGQVYNFANYRNCVDAAERLAWQFDRIEAFATMIGMSSLNWENPEVLRSLKSVLSVEPQCIRETLKENSVIILTFAQSSYIKMYR